MADFSALIAQIEAYVKQNGNNEITGNGLQDILVAMVGAIGGALNDAVSDLESADTTLTNAIGDEELARQGADNTLGGRITAEEEARAGADTGLQNQINGINGKIPDAASGTNKLADKAFVQGLADTLTASIAAINDKIPSEASSSNKLADKAFVQALTTALQNALNTLNGKVPAAATSENQLADKAFVTSLTTALQNAINTINTNIGNGFVYAGVATPPGTPVSGKVAYLTAQEGTYTNYGGLVVPAGISVIKYDGTNWSQEQVISMETIYRNPLMGLYDCDTSGSTAAKTVTAVGYVLPTNGGSMKVRMANHTTVDGVTLNINGTGAKDLYYKGKAAGINNTWDDGAVLNVVYDSTNDRYLAYNANAGTGDGVFDVTEYTGDDYATLEDAIADIPVSEQHGGMMMRFVRSSDNKYMQCRLLTQTFSDDPRDWQCIVEDVADGSKDLVTGDGISKAIKENTEDLKDTIKTEEDDTLYITDSRGNVIGKFDEKGLSVTDVLVLKDTNLVSVFSFLVENIINNSVEDTLYITDARGFVVAEISANGVKSVAFKDKNGEDIVKKQLDGYTLYSLGDSLSAGGKWQQKVSSITGIGYSQPRNIDGSYPLSVGGTITGGDGFDNCLWRTKNLIDKGYITDGGEKNIVIIECVNDINVIGTTGVFDKSANTVVPTTPIEGYNYADWGTSLLESIQVADRKMNACFRLLVTGQSGKNLAITTLPTNEGDIELTITTGNVGTVKYQIHVVPQATSADTLAYVLERILEYNYAGVTDSLANDNESVDFVGYNISVSFSDIGHTGMTVSITDTSTAKSSTAMYFVGDNISDWTDTSKWMRGTDLTFSMAYKSVIEMLLKNYPKLKLFIGVFPALATTPSDYLLPNGNYDTYTFYNTARMQQCRHLQETLAEIGNSYRIPVIDVFGLCGIGVTNYSTYYNDNNVHPKDIGYDKFGEVVAAALCDKIIN